ncbi:hypothetical protein GCM10009096_04560 [Parasphingorhabdus litoris]|uniref:Flagellar hook-length control protein-like C-terminal domain-containing protein n=1 Tax=Parasphingorhabdus litoris TaxID=394733 RepID=A0ABN1A410_9SPHN|nr:flagellar hook-length control protein FliK [Parasphingorhabdus litoris]
MIGKIMSEAAHSIIGMLSAKPVSMETKTANLEFSSLLLPGEDPVRSAPDGADAETAEDKSDEQFLEQLVGGDDLPVLRANEREFFKTAATNFAADQSEGDSNLPTDPLTSMPSTAEIGRFHSVTLSKTDMFANIGPVEASIDVAETALENPKQKSADAANIASIPLTFVDGVLADRDVSKTVDGHKAPASAEKQSPLTPNSTVAGNLNPSSVENQATVESKASAALKPLVEGKPLADSNAVSDNSAKIDLARSSTNATSGPHSDINLPKQNSVETIATKSVLDSGVPNQSKTIGLSKKIQSGTAPDQTITEVLDLPTASKAKVEDVISRQISKSQADDMALTNDKPIKLETKPSFAEMDSRPAASHLERSIELSAPVQSPSVSGATNGMQKVVNFDWNAPLFAERFASELSDLTATGDLKKFEINPRNMGRLEVSFAARGGAEILQIEAESEAAREVIMQHSQAIQDMLKAQGRSDVTLRVDVRDNMLASSGNDSMNFAQQDRSDTQEERSNPTQHYGQTAPLEGPVDPQMPTDNSRYA